MPVVAMWRLTRAGPSGIGEMKDHRSGDNLLNTNEINYTTLF